jgi:hypothetical protein
MKQGREEKIGSYVSRLREKANDCEFGKTSALSFFKLLFNLTISLPPYISKASLFSTGSVILKYLNPLSIPSIHSWIKLMFQTEEIEDRR